MGQRSRGAFSGRPARGIANRFVEVMQNEEESILPFPLQNAVTRPLRTESARQHNQYYLSLWAGQGVRLARQTSTPELIAQLKEEITAAVAELAK